MMIADGKRAWPERTVGGEHPKWKMASPYVNLPAGSLAAAVEHAAYSSSRRIQVYGARMAQRRVRKTQDLVGSLHEASVASLADARIARAGDCRELILALASGRMSLE